MSVATEKTRAKGGFGETVKVVIQALLLALVVRTFLFQPFNIPSGSMKATLLVGDYLFVSKFAYGYSRHSLPFSLPLFEGRVFGALPERGDVAVFKLPSDNRTDYIKRIVGLPGDRLQVRKGILYINGEPDERVRIENFRDDDGSSNGELARYRETLPGGRSFEVLDIATRGALDVSNDGQGERQLSQLAALQDGSEGRRVCRRHHARLPGVRVRGQRRERLHRS